MKCLFSQKLLYVPSRKEGSLTQRFLNFLQNSFLLEILFKQFTYHYSPQKKDENLFYLLQNKF